MGVSMSTATQERTTTRLPEKSQPWIYRFEAIGPYQESASACMSHCADDWHDADVDRPRINRFSWGGVKAIHPTHMDMRHKRLERAVVGMHVCRVGTQASVGMAGDSVEFLVEMDRTKIVL